MSVFSHRFGFGVEGFAAISCNKLNGVLNKKFSKEIIKIDKFQNIKKLAISCMIIS